MEITYKSNKLEKQLTDEKEIIKAYGKIRGRKLRKRLDDLYQSPTLAVVKLIPAAKLHPLIGDKLGEWAVYVVKNWRLCFEITNSPIPQLEDGGIDLEQVTAIEIISVEDYH